MADILRANADIVRQRVRNSHHIHPEFASPVEMAFWLRAFRDMGKAYAADLDRWAEFAEDIRG